MAERPGGAFFGEGTNLGVTIQSTFKFGFIEEIQDTEIQDTRYRTAVAVRIFHILYLVSCNLYLAAKPQFELASMFSDLPHTLHF